MEAPPIEIKNMDPPKSKKKKRNIPERLPDLPFSWILIGPSGSGKSNLLANIIDQYDKVFKHQHRIYISPSLGLDPKTDEIKAKWKYDAFDPAIIESVIKQQKDITISQYDHEQRKMRKGKRMPDVLIILDDCIDSNAFNHKGVLEKLFYRARHFNTSLLITSQKYSALSRGIRLNAKQCSFFKPYNESENEHILKEHAGNQKREQERLKSMLDSVWANKYHFIHIDYLKDPDQLYQCCFHRYLEPPGKNG